MTATSASTAVFDPSSRKTWRLARGADRQVLWEWQGPLPSSCASGGGLSKTVWEVSGQVRRPGRRVPEAMSAAYPTRRTGDPDEGANAFLMQTGRDPNDDGKELHLLPSTGIRPYDGPVKAQRLGKQGKHSEPHASMGHAREVQQGERGENRVPNSGAPKRKAAKVETRSRKFAHGTSAPPRGLSAAEPTSWGLWDARDQAHVPSSGLSANEPPAADEARATSCSETRGGCGLRHELPASIGANACARGSPHDCRGRTNA